MKIIRINSDSLYHGYKPSLEEYYKKFFFHNNNNNNNNNQLLWINTPICQFAIEIIKNKKNVLKNLEKHIFVKYEYARYADAISVKNNIHKYILLKRMVKLIKSISWRFEYGLFAEIKKNS